MYFFDKNFFLYLKDEKYAVYLYRPYGIIKKDDKEITNLKYIVL